jgi:hypothetical protein
MKVNWWGPYEGLEKVEIRLMDNPTLFNIFAANQPYVPSQWIFQ